MKSTFIPAVAVALFAGWAISPALADGSSKAAEATPKVDPKDAAKGDEVLREARTFLTQLRDGADEKAYGRMSDDFRKEQTAEEFATDAGAFRGKSPMPVSMSVTGDVWLKPKDGGPLADVKPDRRASVDTSDDGTRAEAVIVMQQTDAGAPAEGL